MKKIAQKIIKLGVFFIFSFIFLNIYFPLADSDNAQKNNRELIYHCQGEGDDPTANNCQVEILSDFNVYQYHNQ